MKTIFISEGWRMLKRRYSGPSMKFEGDAKEICTKIVERCWNGRYFQTSLGHFSEFWMRDFGWSTESLMRLGYKEEIKKTLEYALDKFEKHGSVTTTISPGGKCFNFPYYAPDSLGYLIHSLYLLNDKEFVLKHRKFLNSQISFFYNEVIDVRTGLVKKYKIFSSMRDHSIRKSSCYDNCVVARMAREIQELKLYNPFTADYEKLIEDHYWNGEFFYDDSRKENKFIADSNIIPFVFGVVKDKDKLKKVIDKIIKNKLDLPIPLRYTNKSNEKQHWTSKLVSGYETTAVWTHMGPMYIKLVKSVDVKLYKDYLKEYSNFIEKNKNYLEGFDEKGNPFESYVYKADEGMIWAANYLTL